MLVGFELFNAESLRKYQPGLKPRLLGRYQELVNGFHRAGIAVFGGFIIGADEDDEDTAADTALKAVQLGVDIIQVTNLTPLPGTDLYDRLGREGRLIATGYPRDWERYTFIETVYRPMGMTAQRLDETMFELRKAAAEEPWVWKRTLRTLWMTRSLSTALFVHGMNRGWARMARNQVPRDAERFGRGSTSDRRARTIRRSFSLRCGALGA
jgi:radical SAM superfamily enzyme YgiQ (UPF0313 family)